MRAEGVHVVQVARQLAEREPVPRGQRVEADERRERRIRQVALDADAAERVRAVADDDRHARAGARAQRERERPGERVVARADVLQVDDERVEAAERRPGRRAPRAVEAHDREPGGRVARRAHRGVVLRGTPEPVLRREQAHEPHAREIREQRRGVGEPRIDRRLVGEQRDPPPPQQRAPAADEDLETGFDAGHSAR